MNIVIRLQRELLQQELKNLRVRGALVELCRDLEKLELEPELKNKVSSLIEEHRPKWDERYMFIMAMGIDNEPKVGENPHPEIKLLDEEYLKKETLPSQINSETYEFLETSNSDADYAGVFVPQGETHDPKTVILRSVNKDNKLDKGLFLDLIEKMPSADFEKFCQHIDKLQDFCTFNQGFWATEYDEVIRGNEDKFWKLYFFNDEEEEPV